MVVGGLIGMVIFGVILIVGWMMVFEGGIFDGGGGGGGGILV